MSIPPAIVAQPLLNFLTTALSGSTMLGFDLFAHRHLYKPKLTIAPID
jgi:hypothetical protein